MLPVRTDRRAHRHAVSARASGRLQRVELLPIRSCPLRTRSIKLGSSIGQSIDIGALSFSSDFKAKGPSLTISLKRLDQYDQGAVDVSLVGSKVRAARQSVGYSIDDLAETCGLTGAEIIEIEEGQDADPARLKRIASALQVSLESLLDEQA